jgi:hypothetical protein
LSKGCVYAERKIWKAAELNHKIAAAAALLAVPLLILFDALFRLWQGRPSLVERVIWST